MVARMRRGAFISCSVLSFIAALLPSAPKYLPERSLRVSEIFELPLNSNVSVWDEPD